MTADDTLWCSLGFAAETSNYKSPSQIAGSLSEGWVGSHMFCPNCGAERLNQLPKNSPVADFDCLTCGEEFELKAKNGRLGRKVVDGAYATMLARLKQRNNPNLLAMAYNRSSQSVTDLILVPRYFFTETIIEAKKPTWPKGRSAPWHGCNIVLGDVPAVGRIGLIKQGQLIAKSTVLAQWQATRFLRDVKGTARGWLLDVMKAVEDIGRSEFTLEDVYAFEGRLSGLYPGNNNVRPKIRQQLQVLRDQGFLEFTRRGEYRLRRPA